MQGATTDGTEFSQTVTGTVAYNQLAPVTETGLPASASTTIDPGTSVPITVTVTNTTNHAGHVRTATLGQRHQRRQYHHADRTGGRSHRDTDGDAVAHGSLGNRGERHPQRHRHHGPGGSEPAIGFPLFSDFHDFAYAYTVGAASTGDNGTARASSQARAAARVI